MWHIAKRELYDNLNSLRFALATVLLFGLMITNAVVHLWKHPERVQEYRYGVAEYQNRLKPHAEDSLYKLAQQGPGELLKKPSPLHFCAEGGEPFLSDSAEGGYHRWGSRWWGYTLESFWILAYSSATASVRNVRPDVTKVDWGFIIGYILSLIALLFTFDSISSEREQGTLRLMLANSISRHTVLTGKFLGALMSVSIPFTVSVLMNLFLISTSSDVHLNAEMWSRLGVICSIAYLYICLFLALGLLVSARVQRSAVSLVILLLVWIVFVVFMPNTLASIAGEYTSPKSALGFNEHSWQLRDELQSEYRHRYGASEDPTKKLQVAGEYVTKDAEQQERLHEERLNQQISQVNRARTITRLSPVTIVQHLFESFAGTGFERHLQFLENVKIYAREYREFVLDTDRSDPESLHIIGVREGMSQKSVSPEAVPKFEDTLNLSKDFNTSAMDLLLLTLFFIILLSGAYLAFVRVEV
ncbi:MAG: ABC transporter permease subunit [Gammaproteobacteria bacterium]|nr:ABC transporter permease subunit [Candidatus Poribacteria bacterium]MYG05693.1 ABC transporter permease subunit [Candidatus Poribacteria bacterium]MYK42747.1 ABC transporter permease subunit [Gammaproteobacteria bacterium]